VVERETKRKDPSRKGIDHVDSAARQRLIDAALVIIDRDGIDGARLRDIVAEAGLTTGSLYWFFTNRRHLINSALAHRYVAKMRSVLEATRQFMDSAAIGIDPLELALQEAAQPARPDRVEARRERIQVLAAALDDPILAAQVAEVNREFTAQLIDTINEARERGLVRDDLDPLAMATMMQATAVGFAVTDIAPDLRPATEDWMAVNRVVVDALRPKG
jgi:AcrR family transcriptional regulator